MRVTRTSAPAGKAGSPPLTSSDAVFAAVRAGNAFEEAVERILVAIRIGIVGDGERLPSERELATRLRISRMTLREAIGELQRAGYVETRRGRSGGTFVVRRPQPEPRDPGRIARGMGAGLEDALALREVLEPGTAALVAGRRVDAAAADYLRSRLREVETAPPDAYRHADSRFHLAVAELSGAPSLVSGIAGVRSRLNELLDAMPLLPHNLAHSQRQHQRLVRAIVAGDAVTARRVMEEHLAGTAALLRGFLGDAG